MSQPQPKAVSNPPLEAGPLTSLGKNVWGHKNIKPEGEGLSEMDGELERRGAWFVALVSTGYPVPCI